MLLEKTLESPLDCKEIQPVHPKGDQSWVTDSMDMRLSELRELVMDREAWRAAIHGATKIRTRLSD